MDESCFVCRKHAGREPPPPGGYLLSDDLWRVCHAPSARGPAGTLLVELRRHALGLGDLTPEEASALGPLLRQVCAALTQVTDAERIYTLMTVEGAPHVHLWLVPRPANANARGLAYLQRDLSCDEDDAQATAAHLRAALTEAGARDHT